MTSIKHWTAGFTLALLIVTPALGQTARTTEAAPTWKAHVGDQLVEALASPKADARERAMRLVIEVAQHYEDVDLSPVVPDLLTIYRLDRKREHRVLALAALHATGSDYGMDRLAELAQHERSLTVKRLAYAAVADHRAGL